MSAKLVAEEGDLKGLVLSLESGQEWIIGRDPMESQLVIEDPLTSRKHALVRQTVEGITIANLSSTNPTRINDEEMSEVPRLLREGDLVKIGSGVFRYYPNGSVPASEPKAEIAPEEAAPSPDIVPGEADSSPKEGESRPSLPEEEAAPLVEEREDSVFDDSSAESSQIAQINFSLSEAGRWLLKVVSGPNNGAEFYMEAGKSYLLGNDPHVCDIVFYDTSVSRQHAKITITPEETLFIEDLKSRNGVVIDGATIEGKRALSPSVIVTIGTTAFVVYDREGEMHTIISPLLPSIVKGLKNETEAKTTEGVDGQNASSASAPLKETLVENPAAPPPSSFSHLLFLGIVTGLFLAAGLGIYTLFNGQPLQVHTEVNAVEEINVALEAFPAVKFSYNKSTNSLLLLGHVATAADKNQLLYNLQGLKFIQNIDDGGIVIDEYVWQEINSVLSKNPSWRGVNIRTVAAGDFLLSGYLETRKQSEQLSDYLSINFPYLDLLKKNVVVEEDVLNQVNNWLNESNLRTISAKMSNGEISLNGTIPSEQAPQLTALVDKIKDINGVRMVNNFVRLRVQEGGVVNLSARYEVTGQSRLGDTYNVVINGRLYSEGMLLDGMKITSITSNAVLLEKDGVSYRIDYKR